jgi:murein DD-endopeptidase MepM/ murein hydrolase activator NlpD
VSPHGGFAYVRRTPAEGACGSKSHPCVHPGVDLLGKRGTKVVAPEDGTIIRTANGSSSPFTGYGPWLVVFQGRSGLYHLLAHLDPATAAMGTPGVPVRAGTVLGTTSSANHVHWEVRRAPTPPAGSTNLQNNLDPFAWLGGARSPGPGWILVAAVAAFLLVRR